MTPSPLRRRAALAATAATGLWLAGCASAARPRTEEHAEGPAEHPAELPGATQRDWTDPASGLIWRVWVQAPPGPAPATGHPVLYVLDGNACFAMAAQLARNSAGRPADMRGGQGSAVVVGIGHPGDAPYDQPARQRDYTPPAPGQGPTAQAGGADRLLDFIAHQVQPHLQERYAMDPQRQTLFGHSFGGLLVLHALFTRPRQFTRYAAASPSVWWNQGQVMQTAQAFTQRPAAPPRAWQAQLQLRLGALERAEAAPSATRSAVLQERRMWERIHQLTDALTALQWPELQVQLGVLPGLDHGAVMAPALIDALALAQAPRGFLL